MELQETLGGRYKLLHELGTGGMAVVWRARDEVLGRPVAVKVLAGRFAGDPQSRARIRDEARAAATLSHPNIAQVYDYGESTEGDSPLPYVVMELVNGPTLQQRVASGPLPPRTSFRICGEVAAALAAAHADGLVHRDIKMANIMVTPSGAKVVDFGIAAAIGPAAPEEMLVGTPAYLAPERLTGDAVQPASDVYALGVLLYRLLAHEAPWTAETTTQMLNAHIYVEPAPMPAIPGVPPEVADLVDRCLRKRPTDRPSAAEVSATLADAAEASLVSVRGAEARPLRPAARVTGEEFDELTSVSAHGLGTETEDRAAESASHGSESAESASGGSERAARPAGSELGAAAVGSELGAAAVGSELGTPAVGATPSRGPAADGGRGPANIGALDDPPRLGNGRNSRRPDGAGHDPSGRRDNERDEQLVGARAGRPGSAGSMVPAAWPGSPVKAGRPGAVGDEANPVRKKRLKYLLAGGGIAVVVVGLLIFWGLSGRSGPAPKAPTADAKGVVAASASAAAQPAPSVSGDGSTVLPDGAVVTGRPALGVTNPAASVAPSAVATVTATATKSAPQPSASATSNAPAAPIGTRLTSEGGVVYAVCSSGEAQLTSWEPASGYTVQKVAPGPALAPEIVFKNAPNRYRMTVTCVAGSPTSLVLPL